MAERAIDPTSDHDGRDLRELLVDHARPSSWPQDPYAEPTQVEPEYREVDRESMTEEDWMLVNGLDQRILDGNLRCLSGCWMAAALHMENLCVFDFWVDTFVSKVLQPYYLWRRDKQGASKLPEQETLCRIGFLLTYHFEDQQSLITGEIPVAQDETRPEFRANTLACQTVVAAARLIRAYPSFFPLSEGPPDHRFFGVHTDHFLLAIYVVRYYWNRRTAQGNKYLLGRRRLVDRNTYVTRLSDASKELGPVAAEEPLEIEGTPAQPAAPVGTKKVARPKKPKPVVRKDTTEQEAKLQRAISKINKRLAKASDESQKEHLEWLRDERRDDLRLLQAEPRVLFDAPAMSDADLERLSDRLRAVAIIDQAPPPQPLPVEIPKDQMSSIFEANNQTVLTEDDAQLAEGASIEEAQQDDPTPEQAWADAEALAMQQKRQNELEGRLSTSDKRRIAALLRKRDTSAVRAIAASGARNPDELSVEKSVLLMGGSADEWQRMPVNPARPDFTYRPHQLSAIGTLVQALESPKKMSILAMGTGTGKTITFMGAAQYYNQRRRGDIEDGVAKDVDQTYRPIMVFTLATITPQTVKEITDHFSGIFNIYCVYGTASHERDEDLRSRIIDGNRFEKMYRDLDPRDPETANTVFITSYMTFVRRFTYQKKDVPYHQLDEVERLHLGLVEEPADVFTKRFTLSRLNFPLHVGLLICDEAHVIKNVSVRMHLAIASIVAQARIMSSATPLLNRPDDVIAYLSLGFNHIPKPPTPKGWPLAKLYSDSLDPHAKIGTQPYRHYKTDKTMKPCPMPGPCALDDGDHPGFRTIREAFDTHGERLWLFSPHLYRSTAAQGGGAYTHYDTALRYIMQYFCIRRDMDTAIELPNGKICTPGDDIPAAHYITKQLSLTGEGKKTHDEMLDQILPYLYKQGKVGDGEADATPGTGATSGAGARAPVKKIDHGAWRMSDLLAINPNDGKLLRLGEWLRKKEEAKKHERNRRTDNARRLDSDESDDQGEDQDDQDNQDGHVALGAAETNALIREHGANEAGYMFRQTAGDSRVPVPSSRIELVSALVRQSAVASAAIIEAIEIIQGPREYGLPNRLVVMVDSPWTQLFATTIFELVGFKTANIRAVQSPEQRQAVINTFNDPDSDVDVLITNIRLSSAGVNLHLACHRGQLWCCPWNASTILQILGRLVRIGQRREVQWTIFTVAGTIFELRELNAWKKYARNLAAESIIQGIEAQWGIGAMYEVVRVLFGQPFSRYIVEVLQPAVGAFNNRKLVTLAHAVSDIIRHALANEDAKQVLNQKSQLDLVACGIRLVQARQASPDLAVSTEFTQQNANIIPFETEMVDVGCDVATHNLATAIKKNRDRRLGLKSPRKRKRDPKTPTKGKAARIFKSAHIAHDTSESDADSPLRKKSKTGPTGVDASKDAFGLSDDDIEAEDADEVEAEEVEG